MTSTPSQPPKAGLSDRRKAVVLAVSLLVLWAPLLWHLSLDWRINPQYSYGFALPMLAVYLFFVRWPNRPEPKPPQGLGWIGLGVLVLAATSLLPLRIVEESNPEWRVASWYHGIWTAAFSAAILYLAGGIRWVRYFAAPVGLTLLAIPWPSAFEGWIVQHLMRTVAAIAVEVANWVGFTATQEGNLIHLRAGTVGVDEACSGVRSFQSTLMVCVFLGAWYRFSANRRVALLVVGVGVSFLLNLARAIFLTLITAYRGTGAITSWHDPAGFLVLGGAFAILWSLARKLQGPSPTAAFGLGGHGPHAPEPMSPMAPSPWAFRTTVALAVWVCCAEATKEAWFRAHEQEFKAQARWTIDWPTNAPGFRFEAIEDEVPQILRYSEAQSSYWPRVGGSAWWMYWFRWAPGRAAAHLARAHTPEICIPAGGLRLLEDLGKRVVTTHGLAMPFRVLRFGTRTRDILVFYCVWEERPDPSGLLAGDDPMARSSRLRAAWHGRRHLGQTILEVAMVKYDSPDRGFEELTSFLNEHLRILSR